MGIKKKDIACSSEEVSSPNVCFVQASSDLVMAAKGVNNKRWGRVKKLLYAT